MADRSVGAKIKQYMQSNGITQAFVSTKTNIPTPILNAILNSKRNLLAEEYFLICETLGIPLQMFKLSNKEQAS